MTSPNSGAAQLVARLRELGLSIRDEVPTDSITLDKLAPEVRAQLGAGGGGGSISVDPDDADYLVASGGAIAPDPADPDYLTFT